MAKPIFTKTRSVKMTKPEMAKKVTKAQAMPMPNTPVSACASAAPTRPPPLPAGPVQSAAPTMAATKSSTHPNGCCQGISPIFSTARITSQSPKAPLTRGKPHTPMPKSVSKPAIQLPVIVPVLLVSRLSKVKTEIKTRPTPITSGRCSNARADCNGSGCGCFFFGVDLRLDMDGNGQEIRRLRD